MKVNIVPQFQVAQDFQTKISSGPSQNLNVWYLVEKQWNVRELAEIRHGGPVLILLVSMEQIQVERTLNNDITLVSSKQKENPPKPFIRDFLWEVCLLCYPCGPAFEVYTVLTEHSDLH